MPTSNGIITAPVSIADVQQCLGVTSDDIKTLCMSDKINKWAKWKPEDIGDFRELTVAQRESNNFGLICSEEYAGSNIVSAILNGTFNSEWTYTRIAAESYGRLTDFLNPAGGHGYYHLAPHPFPSLEGQVLIINGNSDVPVTMLVPISVDDKTAVTLGDFKDTSHDRNFSEWYAGIILVNSSHTIAATSEKPVKSETHWQINIGAVPLSWKGEYTAVPILAQSKIAPLGVITAANRFVGLDNNGVKIKLAASSEVYVLFIQCEYTNIDTRIKYKVSITNNSSAARVFTNPVIQIATSYTGTNQMTLTSFDTQTVAANSEWSESGIIGKPSGVSASGYRYCRLYVPGTGDSGWVNFMESLQPVGPVA